MQTPATPLRNPPKTRDLLRVLVVDDDPLQLEINADLLRSLGLLDITTAISGDLALKAVSRAPGSAAFDLMLCDLYMPHMDGFQFMEAVARNGFSGALIIVSGQSSDVMHSASLVARLRRFKLLGTLGKPVQRGDLSELLAKLSV
jgi:CheY-like chemotaxis protein